MPHVPDECEVSGALALTLRVSRAMGVAPLRMTRVRSGWRVAYWPRLSVYCLISATVVVIFSILNMVWEFSLDYDHAFLMKSLSARFFMPISDVFIKTAGFISGWGTPARTEHIVKCLSTLQTIQSQIRKKPSTHIHYIWATLGLFLVICAKSQVVLRTLFDVFVDTRNLMNCIFFNISYIEAHAMSTLTMLQFVFMAMAVKNAFKDINDMLEELITCIDSKIKTNALVCRPDMSCMTISDNFFENEEVMTPEEAQEIVRRLILSYCGVCDVTRQVDDSFGMAMFTINLTFVIFLVVMPFFFITYLLRTTDGSSIFWTLVHTLSIVFDYTLMMIAYEPGSRVEAEMTQTRVLVNQLIRRVSSADDPLGLQLELFVKQIDLNKVSFSPLGFFTLNRYLITAMTSIGITLSVVILQYQTLGS